MAERHYADRLADAMRQKESQVVVGLDPRIERLPQELRPDQGANAEACAKAVLAFNEGLIASVAGAAVAVKPQLAFYERLGCEGLRALSATIRCAREAGLLVIADAKRNDIASTAAAYAEAYLGPARGAAASGDFRVDAVTVTPYLGEDGIRPFLACAAANGGAVYALVKTSNPSSADVQDLPCADGRKVYESVASLVETWGAACRGEGGYSALGAVVGATYPQELRCLRSLMPHTPLLVPGFGAQGGGVADVLSAFDGQGMGALVNSSRGVIFAWEREPYAAEYGPSRWRQAVGAAAERMRGELWAATH